MLSVSDFNALSQWADQASVPADMRIRLQTLLSIYESLAMGKNGQRTLLYNLRQAMGITRKSEKGSLDEKK